MARRIISLILCFGFMFQQVGFAQVAAELNLGNYFTQMQNALVQDKFRPVHLRYFSYNPANDNLKVLLDKGDLKNIAGSQLESSTRTLLNYFLVGVTLSDTAFWVNLRPDSEEQIIENELAKTDVGKIMLEADLQLKKDTAKFTSPETAEGKEYWDRLYKKAGEIFGSENISIPTLTRPWIVPNEIIIRETSDSAYVYKATLKVMLEQDHLKDSAVYNFKDERLKVLNEYSSELIRELIIPKLNKEVNTSKRYAALRQVFYSLILSRWFKSRFRDKSGTYASLIDKRELAGLTSKEEWSKTTYFQEYQKSFKEGEYNIKEPVYASYGQTIRSYFSGGTDLTPKAMFIPSAEAVNPKDALSGGWRAGRDIADAISRGQEGAVLLNLKGLSSENPLPADVAIISQGQSQQKGNGASPILKAQETGSSPVGERLSTYDLLETLYSIDFLGTVIDSTQWWKTRSAIEQQLNNYLKGLAPEDTKQIQDCVAITKKGAFFYKLETLPEKIQELENSFIESGKIVMNADDVAAWKAIRFLLNTSYTFTNYANKRITEHFGRIWFNSVHDNPVSQLSNHLDSLIREGQISGELKEYIIELIGREKMPEDGLYYKFRAPNLYRIDNDKAGLKIALRERQQVGAPEERQGAASLVKIEPISVEDATAQIDYLMRMLTVKDYPRVIKMLETDTDVQSFVESGANASGKSIPEFIQILDNIPYFAPISAYYRVRTAGTFDPKEFARKRIEISLDASGYNIEHYGDNPPEPLYKDAQAAYAQEFPLASYLKLMRDRVGDVPFVFRDNMEKFVGEFLDLMQEGKSDPDLRQIIDKIKKEFFEKFKIDLSEIKYIFTSGIGANEMYSHQLAAALNAYFQAADLDVKWIVVNNPEHLSVIPKGANDDNSIFFEMSRSGNTAETVNLHEATKDRFTKRIVVANSGKLNLLGAELEGKDNSNVLIINNTPGDIGGRQMNRKTLMTYAPLFLALAAGLKDISKAEEFLRYYCQELYNANDSLRYGKEKQIGKRSLAVEAGEFFFIHREAGRNKPSIIYDNSLLGVAKELIQPINEGANEFIIAGNPNFNILNRYSLQDDRVNYRTLVEQAPDSQLFIFLLNKNNGEQYAQAMEDIKEMQNKGIPVLVFNVDLKSDFGKDQEQAFDVLRGNLQVLAKTTALLQDMAVYFTYISRQDPNSNPEVKLVRELTSAIGEIIEQKISAGKNTRITLTEVLEKIREKRQKDAQTAKTKIDKEGVLKSGYNASFDSIKGAINQLAKDAGIPMDIATGIWIASISRDLFKISLGEAGGQGTAVIEEAFARAQIKESIGALSQPREIKPLDRQITLTSNLGTVSVALGQGDVYSPRGVLAEQLADYLYQMYQEKKGRYFALTFMESDDNNPIIKALRDYIDTHFADLNITCLRQPIPGFAHAGIEAPMAHPSEIINLTVAYTNTYGEGLGAQRVGNLTLDQTLYMYMMSNALRMALGGTPSVFFELKDGKDLAEVRNTIIFALDLFRKKIDSAASSAVKLVDGAKMVTITNKNIKDGLWGTAGYRGIQTDPNDFSIDNVSRQTAGFAEEVLERISKGEYTPINGKKVRVAFAFDSRKDSDEYAYEMAKVLAAYEGFEVEILDEALPTPIVARLTQKKRSEAYDFAFHVTPSHNQLQYGGIKLLFEGSVNEHMWTYFFEERANAKMEYPVNTHVQLKKIQVVEQLIKEYLQEVFPGLLEKFASFRRLNPDAQFIVDLMDGSMASFAPLFERLGITIVRSGRMKDIDYSGRVYVLADGKKVGFAPDPTQSAFYKDQPEYQEFLKSAPEGSIYFLIDGDGDRLVTIIKKNGQPTAIKPNQFGPLAADYILTNHLLPEVDQIVRTYVTTAGMDAVAKYHGLADPEIVPVGSKYFNRFVPRAIALEESGHFVAGDFFDDTIYQMGLMLSMMSQDNKDLFTMLAETQERTGYKGVDKRDDFENLLPEVKAKFIAPLTGTPEDVRVKSQQAVNAIVAQSGKELLEALVVVEGEYGIGRVVRLEEYVDSLFTNNPLVIESNNKGIIIRFKDLSWGGARLSGTGNTGRLYTEGRESHEERQKIADGFVNTLDLPKVSSPLAGEEQDSADLASKTAEFADFNDASGEEEISPSNSSPVIQDTKSEYLPGMSHVEFLNELKNIKLVVDYGLSDMRWAYPTFLRETIGVDAEKLMKDRVYTSFSLLDVEKVIKWLDEQITRLKQEYESESKIGTSRYIEGLFQAKNNLLALMQDVTRHFQHYATRAFAVQGENIENEIVYGGRVFRKYAGDDSIYIYEIEEGSGNLKATGEKISMAEGEGLEKPSEEMQKPAAMVVSGENLFMVSGYKIFRFTVSVTGQLNLENEFTLEDIPIKIDVKLGVGELRAEYRDGTVKVFRLDLAAEKLEQIGIGKTAGSSAIQEQEKVQEERKIVNEISQQGLLYRIYEGEENTIYVLEPVGPGVFKVKSALKMQSDSRIVSIAGLDGFLFVATHGNDIISRFKMDETTGNLQLDGEFKGLQSPQKIEIDREANELKVQYAGGEVSVFSLDEAGRVKFLRKENKGSSPMEAPEETGGIDFRAMNIITQPMGSFQGLNFKLPTLSKAELATINLDTEMEEIRNMMNNGIIPSGQRIKEFVAACYQKGELHKRADDLIICLADICRLEEENFVDSSPELRETLVILDSGRFALAKL